MKLGLVIKNDKRNTQKSKRIDDDVMSTNCNVVFIFSTCDKFGAIWKPDPERIYIFINNNLLFYKH